MMTLLEMVQDVCRELTLPVPSSIVGSTDPSTAQMRALFQREGDMLRAHHDWTFLTTPWTIIVADQYGDATPFPADYLKVLENSVFYRVSTRSPLNGPISPEEWQNLRVYGVPYLLGAWRLFDGALNIFGIPSGETVTGEYMSRNWIMRADGTTTSAKWVSDTDTPRFDDVLMRLGVKWRWKAAQGFNYAQEEMDYRAILSSFAANDRGLRLVPTARVSRDDGLPEASWPGQVVISG
jgi:hypothetical protein